MKEKILFNLEKRGRMTRKDLYKECVKNDTDYINFKIELKKLIDNKKVSTYYNTNLCYKIIA